MGLSGGKKNKIKYISAYRSEKITTFTNLAEVESIETNGDTGKNKMNFSGVANKLRIFRLQMQNQGLCKV